MKGITCTNSFKFSPKVFLRFGVKLKVNTFSLVCLQYMHKNTHGLVGRQQAMPLLRLKQKPWRLTNRPSLSIFIEYFRSLNTPTLASSDPIRSSWQIINAPRCILSPQWDRSLLAGHPWPVSSPAFHYWPQNKRSLQLTRQQLWRTIEVEPYQPTCRSGPVWPEITKFNLWHM